MTSALSASNFSETPRPAFSKLGQFLPVSNGNTFEIEPFAPSTESLRNTTLGDFLTLLNVLPVEHSLSNSMNGSIDRPTKKGA